MDVNGVSEKALSALFGLSEEGTDVLDRARRSSVEFIRSQDHLSIALPEATGKRLTAFQALTDYGLSKLLEVHMEGIVALPHSLEEPARTIRLRRESLGLTINDVSRSSGLSEEEVSRCEDQRYRNPIRTLDRIAAALGLDERRLAIKPGAEGDESLATRLKRLVSPAKPGSISSASSSTAKAPSASNSRYEASKELVRRLAEAAWVIQTQARISVDLEPILPAGSAKKPYFEKNKDYGNAIIPVWKRGYDLASKARAKLGLRPDEPIASMRAMCWNKLRIPLVQCKLPKYFSGATIASGSARGIVVNTNGYNENVLMRRATIAHELGHFLWDADERLTKVHVDEFSAEDTPNHDPVETRANAFAVAFIAPPETVKKVFEESGGGAVGLRSVMEHFGLSFSASRYHVKNTTNVDLQDSECAPVDREASDKWKAAERLTEDLFPGEKTQLSRVGEFAGLVVAAYDARHLSADTACSYLNMSSEEFSGNLDYIRQLMPIEKL